jgi:hypothetical protein
VVSAASTALLQVSSVKWTALPHSDLLPPTLLSSMEGIAASQPCQ